MIKNGAVLIARLFLGGVFLLAAWMKFGDIQATAGYIASIGFPLPLFFAWLAAFLEVGLALAFFTGAFFIEAAALAAAYVIYLTIAFHGPSRWSDPMAFGLFINHLAFIAALLFAAAHGPGKALVLNPRLRRSAAKRAGGDA